MGKYLKRFTNHTSYEAYMSGDVILPNVSHCLEEKDVHFNPLASPEIWGTVDLGLPSGTLWATMNVGATSETDFGLFFAWGDTQGYTASQVGTGSGQKAFDWNDYKFGSASPFSKYGTDGLTTLELTDDAAYALSNGQYIMPTKTQFDELVNTANTTSSWDSARSGYTLTSKVNGNSIFFPSAGGCGEGSVHRVGSIGCYLTSSLYSDNDLNSWGLYFGSEYLEVGYDYRCYGNSARGVLLQNQSLQIPIEEPVAQR